MRTHKAIKAKRLIGELTDLELLSFISHNEGLTLYELSKRKEWSLGRVQGSLNRLLGKGSVYSEPRGIKKHYFAVGFSEIPDYIG